jgi:hypothetical protein
MLYAITCGHCEIGAGIKLRSKTLLPSKRGSGVLVNICLTKAVMTYIKYCKCILAFP